MSRKIILHIGPHKTGTSFLQKTLLKNKDILKKNEFFYPDLSDDLGLGHHALINGESLESNYFDIIKNSPCDNVIISSENFSRLPSSEIKKLIVDGYEYQVILFLRKPSERMKSYWAELIKHNKLNSFEEFSFDHFLKPYQSEILNPFTLFDRWNEIFGNVKILDYEKYTKSSTLDIVNDFTKAIGIDIDNFKLEEKIKDRVNQGYGLIESEILRNYKLEIKCLDPSVKLSELNVWKIIKDSKKRGFYDLVKSSSSSAIAKDNIVVRPYKEFLEEYLYDEVPLEYLEYGFTYFKDSSYRIFPKLSLIDSEISKFLITNKDIQKNNIIKRSSLSKIVINKKV